MRASPLVHSDPVRPPPLVSPSVLLVPRRLSFQAARGLPSDLGGLDSQKILSALAVPEMVDVLDSLTLAASTQDVPSLQDFLDSQGCHHFQGDPASIFVCIR